MIATLERMAENQAKEMRELAVTLLQGREPQPSTGATETSGILPQDPLVVDYDSEEIPLSAGIQAQISREAAEARERDRLRRERQALLERFAEAREALRSQGIDPQGPASVEDDFDEP